MRAMAAAEAIAACMEDAGAGEASPEDFTAVEGEAWEAWEDGKRVEAADFFVPFGRSFDVAEAEAGANALGVEVSESLNVKKK
jgi:hypothetical protein